MAYFLDSVNAGKWSASLHYRFTSAVEEQSALRNNTCIFECEAEEWRHSRGPRDTAALHKRFCMDNRLAPVNLCSARTGQEEAKETLVPNVDVPPVLPRTTLFSTSVSPIAFHRRIFQEACHLGLLGHKGHKPEVWPVIARTEILRFLSSSNVSNM
jgi:hypothetical protein